MDQNFRKRLQKTLYCGGDLESDHCPLALTELAVEYFQDLAPRKLDYVDLESVSAVTSQGSVSPSSVAMSMVYAKRLQRKRPEYVTKMSSSDLFIISMMMASKYLCDEGVEEEVFNDEWANTTGLDTDDINTMERDFLDALDWELYIRKDDFDQAMLSVEKSVALREGMKRGWFSYTDLHLLLDDSWMMFLGPDRGLEWLQVVAVSSAAYVAGIMVMVGSTVLVTNACVGLSTVGLLPVLLPALHTTPTPAAVPTLLPILRPPLVVICPRDNPPPAIGFRANETGHAMEEEKSGSEGHPQMAGQSVVDTILSQLMAVLTLKSYLAQFVYAVSDGYASNRDRNHSERKAPPRYNSDRCWETEEGTDGCGQDVSTAGSLMSRLFGMEETSAEMDWCVGSCCKCGKQKAPLSSDRNPSLLHSSHCLHGSQNGGNCKDYWEWMKSVVVKPCHGLSPLCHGAKEGDPVAGTCCRSEQMASMHSLFPDVAIGFSTSMPPAVYAT
ncbi:hypothetical protein ACOMHN_025089 [Nucella lapillus]